MKTRIVSIDYGTARIGIAISDESKIIAFPLKTIKTEKKLEMTAQKLIRELEIDMREKGYQIEAVVIGLPLMMSGKVGSMADEVKQFVEILKKIAQYKICLLDERLTSVRAERSLLESTMSRKKRTKFVDTVSAVIILQDYLDQLTNR